MNLNQLDVHHVRNIGQARLNLHPSYNFILGENGSGKTSLLESIYLLSTGHSFRTRETNPLIQQGHSNLTVFASLPQEETVSIQKSLSGPTIVHINRQPCRSSSELARFLPCQVFYQDIFDIIDAGPSIRRSLLDWGMFHVKPDYLSLWKDYRRILKQRNALLRQRADKDAFIPWDKQLVELSHQLDHLRAHYVRDWMDAFKTILAQLTDTSADIHYYKGWGKKQGNNDLAVIINEQFESDRLRQYTQSGAHQADLIVQPPGSVKAKQHYSRGQQKIILIALKLAQAKLLPKKCVYLFDDLAAELDKEHLHRVFQHLTTITGQFIITAIDLNHYPLDTLGDDYNVFAMRHGQVEDKN
ncbi:DNA replication/repair protein RecF [Legionella yabuuchiae]|uniref:DNA replication/repair protein RecF n=1 Tax=Legionella yabuuchiae TaxID=376727 RepID=UPI0010569184|nr:DNA replication/repair protein RecF [Legionella yabuuchiae]